MELIKKLFGGTKIETKNENNEKIEHKMRPLYITRLAEGKNELERVLLVDTIIPVLKDYRITNYSEYGLTLSEKLTNLYNYILSEIIIFNNTKGYYPSGGEYVNLVLNIIYEFDKFNINLLNKNLMDSGSYFREWLIILEVFKRTKDFDKESSLLYDSFKIYYENKKAHGLDTTPHHVQVS